MSRRTPSTTVAATSRPMTPSNTASPWWPRASTSSTSGANRAGRGEPGGRGRGAGPGGAGGRSPGTGGAGVGRHGEAERRRRRRRCGGHPHQRRGGTLWPVAAELGVGWVAMHRQGSAADMQRSLATTTWSPRCTPPCWRWPPGRAAGVEEIWFDPGIGFGKTVEHNLSLLATWRSWPTPPHPRPHGAHRDQSQALPRRARGASLPVEDRLEGSLATATFALSTGGHGAVHDVARACWRPRWWPRGRRHEGEVGPGHPAAQLHLGHPRPSGHQRAPGASRPTTAASAARRRSSGSRSAVRPDHLPARLAAQPGVLRGGGIASAHYPIGTTGDLRPQLSECYGTSTPRSPPPSGAGTPRRARGPADGRRRRYLLWSGRLASGPQVVAVIERVVGHQMGMAGRSSWRSSTRCRQSSGQVSRLGRPEATGSSCAACGSSAPRGAAEERDRPQPLELDLDVWSTWRGLPRPTPSTTPSTTPSSPRCSRRVATQSFGLLEALAERIATVCSTPTPHQRGVGVGAQAPPARRPRHGDRRVSVLRRSAPAREGARR